MGVNEGAAGLEHANAPQDKQADSEPKHGLTLQSPPVAPGASLRTGNGWSSEIRDLELNPGI